MDKKLTKEQVKRLTHNIPSSRYPWTLETYYARQLRKLVAHWKQIASDHLNRLIKPTVKGGSLVLTDDDDDHSADIALAITIMLSAINNSETDMILGSMATRYVNSVSNFSYNNVQAQAKHVGLQVVEHNSTIDSYTAMKIKENVALIKSMRSDFSSRLEKNIYQAIMHGKGISEIMSSLTKDGQMTNNHAAFIANDQTGKILGQLDGYRAQRAGAESYVWQSMEDSRVRASHQILDQTEQKYDDPDGGDGGQLPGEPFRCRCVALPVFDM